MGPPKLPVARVQLSPEAEFDIDEILEWSEEHFGEDAATRYGELMIQALRDIGDDPRRPGSIIRRELPMAIYSYHLLQSRDRVVGVRVKTPRHFILYRQPAEGVLQVLRILHDSRDLGPHLHNL